MIHLFEPVHIQRKVNLEYDPEEFSFLQPGQFAHDEVVDGYIYENWLNHLSILGRLRQLGSNEPHAGDKDTPRSTHRLYCLPNDITTADRIHYKGRFYNITAVNDVMNFLRLYQVDCYLVEHSA